MIVFGVDQCTIVISLIEKDLLKEDSWKNIAEMIVKRIERTLMIIDVFGKKEIKYNGNFNGYTTGYSYGNHPFYFRICYHDTNWEMGVLIQYSAQSLSFYSNEIEKMLGASLEIYEIIKMLDYEFGKTIYRVRLSRIDFYADLIDENLSVDQIRKDLCDGKYSIWTSKGTRNTSKISFYTKDGIVNTIYIGSRGNKIRTLLRIYNKKLEQIQNHGIYYAEAKLYDSWIRIENEIKHDYAHDITNELRKINNSDDLVNLIGTCLLNKYQILDADGKPHPITKRIKESIKNRNYYFKDSRYNDMSLQRSYEYLTKNSGLISFLYKLYMIDKNAYYSFLNNLENIVKDYEPNKDTQKWMKDHKKFYEQNGIHLITK